MSARTPSPYSATEWLTARPLLIFVLFAIEILAIDFFRLPETMTFDSYAFCDNGANLTIQYLVSRGLRPTIDFGYHYGLLPILIGRIWFSMAGLTPIAYGVLSVACDLAILAAITRITCNLRFGAMSLAATAITLGFAERGRAIRRSHRGWRRYYCAGPSRSNRLESIAGRWSSLVQLLLRSRAWDTCIQSC